MGQFLFQFGVTMSAAVMISLVEALTLTPMRAAYFKDAEKARGRVGNLFETIFEGRLNYTDELNRMGAEIKMYDAQHVTIKGPTPLKGKDLQSPDIRAGLAFLIAANVANGKSTIGNAYLIDRGYEKIELRLREIGVDIKRISV
jgi:UDP-N-acetylglucosamine enolpyruvyl transferase